MTTVRKDVLHSDKLLQQKPPVTDKSGTAMDSP